MATIPPNCVTKKRKLLQIVNPTTITDLPEAIIHEVCANLTLKDISRMSLMCRDWRFLCFTTPYLRIDMDTECEIGNPNDIASKIESLMSFIERLIAIRNGNQLKMFSIRCNLPQVSEYRIESWVLNAIKGHVEDLEVNGVRQSKSRVALDCFEVFDMKFLMPSVNGFHNLLSLTLVLLKLPENPLTLVSTHCTSLKCLTLSQCTGFTNLSVVGSNLELFKLSDPPFTLLLNMTISCVNLKVLEINIDFPTDCRKCFIVQAPNLHTFKWFGGIIKDLDLDFFAYLDSATTTIFCHPVCANDVLGLQRFGNQMFPYIAHAKKLHLCCTSTQVLVTITKSKPWICPFNVEDLTLCTTSLDDVELSYTIFLLSKCPKLRKFSTCEDDSSIWFSNEPLQHEMEDNVEFLPHLEEVTLFVSGSTDTSLSLLLFLLREAKKHTLLKILCATDSTETEQSIRGRISMVQPPSLRVEFFTCPVYDP